MATTAIANNGGDEATATTRIEWQQQQQHNNQLKYCAIGNHGVKVGLHGGGGGHKRACSGV